MHSLFFPFEAPHRATMTAPGRSQRVHWSESSVRFKRALGCCRRTVSVEHLGGGLAGPAEDAHYVTLLTPRDQPAMNEGVSEQVRMHSIDPCLIPALLDNLSEAASCDWSALAQEELVSPAMQMGSARSEVPVESQRRLIAEWSCSLLATFTDDMGNSEVEINVFDGEPHELGGTHPRIGKQHDDRRVASIIKG